MQQYNKKKKKIWLTEALITFDDMIDMTSNKKLKSWTEIFIRGKKLNNSTFFITQSYSAVPKNIRLHSSHYFIMKIPNKQELQQIAFNHSSDIDSKDFEYLQKIEGKINLFFS